MTEELARLSVDIHPLRYVLMRNWETVPPEGDLDFFVHPDDKAALEEACVRNLGPDWQRWVDIRTVGDGYYPLLLEAELLARGSENWYADDDSDMFWRIPSDEAYFLTILYHSWVHKGDDRYLTNAKAAFYAWLDPQPPQDNGVGFHALDSH